MASGSEANRALARFGLAGKSALVTGGTQGIGRAIVEELAQLGASVFTCSRSLETLDAFLQECTSRGMKVQGCVADVSKSEDRANLVQAVSAAFQGKLDMLVNNVGTNIRKPVLGYTDKDFRKLMATNVESGFSMCRDCHAMLAAADGAAIVFNSSVAGGPLAMKSGALYAMSKAAINQLTKNLACDWAKDKIRVNSVAPWYTGTDLAMEVLKEEKYKAEVLARTPMGRIAQVDEVSGVVAFLCGPAASYVTGTTMHVDGGYSVMGFF